MIIKYFKNRQWKIKTSNLILNYLKKLKSQKINIILTGGKSSKKIYNYFFPNLKKINKLFFVYLSDERCVKTNNSNSNYYSMNKKKIYFKCNNMKFIPIIKKKNYKKSAEEYNKKLPSKLDLLMLSVGADGHVASIFDSEKKNLSNKKKVVYIKKKFNGFSRITITWQAIKLAKRIIILCKGSQRGSILFTSIMKKKHILNKIRTLKSKVIFCLDRSAYLSFQKKLKY